MTTAERERWRRLVDLLGLPQNAAEAELLAFLARYLLPPSLTVFDAVVRRVAWLPPIRRVTIDLGVTRGPDCHAWCDGRTDPHGPAECFAAHSLIRTSTDHRPPGEDEITVTLEAVDSVTGGVGVGVGTTRIAHRRLTVVEARQLAASLLDAADVAGGVS